MPVEQSEKRLGRYYTPSDLAYALVEWAIGGEPRTIFDPCYGGCELLNQAVGILRQLGQDKPGRFVYGVDIDSNASQFLVPLIQNGATQSHFLTADFLSLEPQQVPAAPFDVIVANPPFVRHHLLATRKQLLAVQAANSANLSLSKRASYWAYFLIHMVEFLREKGRLAVILPKAILDAAYALPLKSWIISQFEGVAIILVADRLFPAVEEQVVLLLASGYRQQNRNLLFSLIRNTSELGPACGNALRRARKIDSPAGLTNSTLFMLNARSAEAYRQILKRSEVIALGNVASIRIGVVTGANHFFILTRQEAKDRGIPSRFTKPILTRTSSLKGLEFLSSDFDKVAEEGGRVFLLSVRDPAKAPTSIEEYLKQGYETGIASRYKCRIRNPWHDVGDERVPEAYMSYMAGALPRIVINCSRANCTNAIHRIAWSDSFSTEKARAIALSYLSSLTRLGAEIVGRSYGGGVLKLEPTTAQQLPIVDVPPSRDVTKSFKQADNYLRRGEQEQAVRIADELVLESLLGLDSRQIGLLRDGWHSLLAQRTASGI